MGDGWWEGGCDSLRIEIKSTTSHGAKFEGLRKEGTGRLQNLEKGNYIKRRSAPGWIVSFGIMFWIKGTHSACKATVLGNQIF